MSKDFYDKHKNFSFRTLSEYFISPGIRCKFDLLKENLVSDRVFLNAIDLGASGNSFLYFLDNIRQRSYFDIAGLPLKQYIGREKGHPLCGDIIKLPYRNETFDFLTAIDVLEHIKDDNLAISEISRILKKNAIIIISVPHQMKHFTTQDIIIGHYRRYEIDQIIQLFAQQKLRCLTYFGVYGRLMRISDIQSANPEKIESGLINLRKKYETKKLFRICWNLVVKIVSKLMKWDAKYQPVKNIMNIALIFTKE
ncbi:hypothetical protein LCGC14_1215970 [marine sediment metagenome]|uniref:Methyltransferase type 11 domain-containing protein n=1 Tax=marine sediment metagenome TaxID=412755 RepID=A0A0F9PH84_9ZZZZ|nr:MAG: SAM-dependent methyltransferase [Candidatus Lokiarchaeum sp. GC14_75]